MTTGIAAAGLGDGLGVGDGWDGGPGIGVSFGVTTWLGEAATVRVGVGVEAGGDDELHALSIVPVAATASSVA